MERDTQGEREREREREKKKWIFVDSYRYL